MRKSHSHTHPTPHFHPYIYRSRLHQLVTVLFIVLPFAFFLFFAQVAKISSGKLFTDIVISMARMVVAYIVALVLAWTCAVLFYQGRRAAIALPFFDVLQSFPTFAALPLASFFLGPSNTTVIIFLVITIIWPIFFSIISSLHLIRRDWKEAVEISQLSGFAYFKLFLLPITIPGVVTGSLIGLGDGWGALVATEIIVGSRRGLGNFFNLFSQNPQMTVLGILGFLILIFSINKLVWTPLLERSHRKMEE